MPTPIKPNALNKREAALLSIPSRNRYKLKFSLIPIEVTPSPQSRYVIRHKSIIAQKLKLK